MEKLTTIIPLCGALIVVAGVVKLQMFYWYFDISIFQYLETGEILLAFLKDFIFYSLFIIFLIIISSIIFPFTIKTENSNTGKPDKFNTFLLNEESFCKRLKNYFKFLWFKFYLIVIILNIGITMLLKIKHHYYTDSLIITYSLILLFFGVIYIVEYIIKCHQKKQFIISLFKIGIIASIFAYLGYIYAVTKINADNIKIFKSNYGTAITTNDSTYISDSTFYYIGKTNNFVFLYNEKTAKYTALPMSEVKKMEISTNK